MPRVNEDSYRFWDLVLKAGTAIGFILAAGFSYYQYLDTAKRESKKPFLEKQLELCVKAADSAGTIATSPHPEEVAQAKVTLDRLIWGAIAIVDNDRIFKAMKALNSEVKTLPSDGHYQGVGQEAVRKVLTSLSEKIAHACRDHIRTAWDVPNPKRSLQEPNGKSTAGDVGIVTPPSSPDDSGSNRGRQAASPGLASGQRNNK